MTKIRKNSAPNVDQKQFWTIPKDLWKNEPCFIIAGGPSLKTFDCEQLRGKGRTIAVNNAGLSIARWADVFYWSDKRWYTWNQGLFYKFEGTYKITRTRLPSTYEDKTIKILRYDGSHHLSKSPMDVGGCCSSSTALNIAYLFGCNPIYLLGVDMCFSKKGESNWHEGHRIQTQEARLKERFIPAFETMAAELAQTDTKVINVNTNSALKCFPIMTYKELLDQLQGTQIRLQLP